MTFFVFISFLCIIFRLLKLLGLALRIIITNVTIEDIGYCCIILKFKDHSIDKIESYCIA